MPAIRCECGTSVAAPPLADTLRKPLGIVSRGRQLPEFERALQESVR